MTVGHLQAIAPVPAAQAGYSLLTAAQVLADLEVAPAPPEQSEAEPWQQGVEWAPEQVGRGRSVEVACLGNTPGGLPDRLSGDNPIVNTAEPFLAATTDRCSTFGWKGRDWVGRARRQLLATQSAVIARELQLGELRDDQTLANAALVDGNELNATAQEAAVALASIEQAMGAAYLGRQGMVHVDPWVLTLLARDHVLTLQGQKYLTPMGNIVAADAGYGPVDDKLWIYGTLPVQLRLGEVVIVPDGEQARAQATDRATNLTEVWAERIVLVTFDNSADSPFDLMFKQSVTDEAV